MKGGPIGLWRKKLSWVIFASIRLHAALMVSQKWNYIDPSGSREPLVQTRTAAYILDEFVCIELYIVPSVL